MIPFPELLRSIDQLNTTQLKAARQRINFQLQHRSDQTTLEDEDWLLHGINAELRRRGLDNRDSFRVKKDSSFASFNTQSEQARELLLLAAPGLTAIQRRALGEIAAKALADWLSTWQNYSINRETLMRNVGKIPEAIDRAYPTYIETGLLGLIIK